MLRTSAIFFRCSSVSVFCSVPAAASFCRSRSITMSRALFGASGGVDIGVLFQRDEYRPMVRNLRIDDLRGRAVQTAGQKHVIDALLRPIRRVGEAVAVTTLGPRVAEAAVEQLADDGAA